MKLCFSTLGCPRWTWNEITATAKDLLLDGIEIRGIADSMYAPDIREFSADALSKTVQQLQKLGLSVPILSSGAALADPARAQAAFLEAADYINLAARMGVPYIRVMGTDEPQITAGDFTLAAGLYRQLCALGVKKGVTPLIETNGLLSCAADMQDFLTEAGHENSGVLWDVHHSVRYANESPLQTIAALGDQIRHVHVKDSSLQNGRVKYQMMGCGDIPLADTLALLRAIGYDGFVSLEWVKRWVTDLEDAGIVFAQFKRFMDSELA